MLKAYNDNKNNDNNNNDNNNSNNDNNKFRWEQDVFVKHKCPR